MWLCITTRHLTGS